MTYPRTRPRFRDTSAALFLCIGTCTAALLCITIPAATALKVEPVINSLFGWLAALGGIALGSKLAHLWSHA